MKTPFNNFLVLTLAASLCLFVSVSRADVDVSVGVRVNAVADFHAPLAHHGAWIEVGSHGRCWRPARVVAGWRPYCDGHWEWTDCGWYWVSDEPWAWATYHYGSWHHDPFHGWIWIPGVEWSPAWVYWRHGGGHIGWAPCGPRGVMVAPSAYVFVGVGRFRERVRPSTVIVNNTTIINKTTQITEIKRETRNIGGRSQRVIVNEGPGVQPVEAATRQKVAAVPVQEADRRTPVPAEVKRRGGGPASEQSPAKREPSQPRKDRETQPGAVAPSEGVVPPAKNSPDRGRDNTSLQPDSRRDKSSPRPDKVPQRPDYSPTDSPRPEKEPPDNNREPSRDDVSPSPDGPSKYKRPPGESSESSKAKKSKPSKRQKQKSPKHEHS